MPKFRSLCFPVCIALLLMAGAVYAKTPKFSQKGRPSKVPLYEIYEITFKHDTRPYKNPYQEVDIKVDFTLGKDGPAQTVYGFYYGEHDFRVRFMPLKEGKYYYTGTFTVKHQKLAGEKSFKGYFTCKGKPRSANHGPLRVFKDNPFWLICDDQTPVYLNGLWTHSSLDATQIAGKGGAAWGDVKPANFNKFADQAIGFGMIKADGEPTDKYFKEIERRFDELQASKVNFMVITADHMGWGYQTASNWKGLKHGEFTDPFMYDENAGRIWDHALKYATDKGMYIKMNFQEWCQDAYAHHPMQHIKGVKMGDENPDDSLSNPEARKAWEGWLKYLVSRYGAYANVHWQVGNEPPGNGFKAGAAKWKEFVQFMQSTVRVYDPYKKMFDEGGPTGAARTMISDNRVFHDIFTKPSASAYFKKNDYGKPYHFEEVADFPHTPEDGYLKSARYNKMACFMGGGYGTSLVMLSWINNGILPKYLDVCKRTGTFFEPFINANLYKLKPDSSFIKVRPGEFCEGVSGGDQWALYLQKDDANIKSDLSDVPAQLEIELPQASKYLIFWFNMAKGVYDRPIAVKAGGLLKLTPPAYYQDDIALRIIVKP